MLSEFLLTLLNHLLFPGKSNLRKAMKNGNKHISLRLLLLVGLCTLILPASGTRAASTGSPQAQPQASTGLLDFPTDQIIISYQPSSQAFENPFAADQMARLTRVAGVALQYLRSMSGNAHVLKLPVGLLPDQVQMIADLLSALPDVVYAEPDLVLFPVLSPNDTLYSNQWDFFESAGGINIQPAWDITTGSSSVVVAIGDTGLTNHIDLAGRMVSGAVATSGYDFISDSQIANDGDARDSNPSDPGDWITSAESISGNFAGCQVENSSWHGTHVAGTIGAVSNNSKGVAGINWNSKLLIVRVLGKCGGYLSDIADGMTWAAGLTVSGVPANANPARVINLSLGGSGSCSTTFQNTVNAINNVGTVVVVAAGNSNTNVSGFTPANCNGVIAVAATGRTGSRASYSNYGALVKISAPGGSGLDGVLSTLNTGTTVPAADTYVGYQGTSMATPHVTGVVSLMFSVNPSLTPAQVLSILQGTARAFPGGSTCNTSICGSGIVNAGAAVAAAQPPAVFNKTSPANGAIGQPTSLSLAWGSSPRATGYSYCIDTTNNNTCNGSWNNVGNNTSAAVSGLLTNTVYYWQVRASNGWVDTYADSNIWGSFTTLNPYILSVGKTGTGSGGVTSAPAGIDCGSTCSAPFNYNSNVTLTAAASTGSVFTGWSGGDCSGLGICVVTMDVGKSVTAGFALAPYQAYLPLVLR
jgi:serine protease